VSETGGAEPMRLVYICKADMRLVYVEQICRADMRLVYDEFRV
jgi:hypothetical protein